MKTIGIALGGGGAKGLAHIALLQVLEDLGLEPAMISGTSMGAIIGALYASGMKPSHMHEGIRDLTVMPQSLHDLIAAKQLFGWLDYVGLEVGRNSLLNVDKFLVNMERSMGVSDFDALKVPLKVVAADFWARKQVVFDSGPVIPAVAASFALPGLFKPVILEGRVLIDGGTVNPVPYDLLMDHCDIVVAIDVSGQRIANGDQLPSYAETIFNTFQIASAAIVKEKMKLAPPSIYIEPEIRGIKALEFHKFDSISEQASSAAEVLKQKLGALLDQ